ncbi:MAG: hypothetical protein ACOX6U_03950 [Oscillospiraceae bacterium]
MILYSITVNAWQPPYGRLRVIQEEANGREIAVTVTGADGQPIDFTGKAVSVYLEKPDGTKIYNTCAVSGSIVTIPLTAQMTAVYGVSNLFELQIVDAESHTLKVTLPPLYIVPSNHDNAIESSDEFSALSEALASMLNLQTQLTTLIESKAQPNGLATLNAAGRLEQMPTAAEVGAALPNLLLNSDFGVNQRGKTSYSKGQYTADRWYNSSAGTVTIAASTLPNGTAKNMLVISQQASQNTVSQLMENLDSVLGQELTATFWAKAQNAGQMRVGIANDVDTVLNVTTAWQRFTVRLKPTEANPTWTVNGLFFQSAVSSAALGTLYIAEPQLVYGTCAGAYAPPNPAEELLKCQRYYYVSSNNRIYGYTNATNETSKTVYPTVALPAAMRTVPTVTMPTNGVTIRAAGKDVHLVSIEGVYLSDRELSLNATADAAVGNRQAISGWFDVANRTTFDAEIYQ